MLTFIVNKTEEGMTLEKYIKKVLKDYPLSLIYKTFRKKDIKVNNIRTSNSKEIIHENDEIKIYLPDQIVNNVSSNVLENNLIPNERIKNWIIYEDDNILIINKPSGILVQKDDANKKALDDMVKEYLMSKDEYHIEDSFVPGPAHRLDRNTSGLVIFGKNHETLVELSELIKNHTLISKHYLAVALGKIEKDGEINVPLLKDNFTNIVKVAKEGKEAITKYHVVKAYDNYTVVDITLLTGRTHQIRVHMAYIDHPILGDSKYGDFLENKRYGEKSQLLHASEIHFGKLNGILSYLSSTSFKVDPPDNFNNYTF